MTSLTADAFSSKEYDFLVVGGGTAGLILSARLSENSGVTVGVIEAGGDNSDVAEVNLPGMAGQGLKQDRLNWKFNSIPQVGANDRVIACPRGKGIGGSSALNFMVYSRANTYEYDAIEALGNDGWNWSSFLHYMKKAETFTGPPDDIKQRYHIGTNGDAHGFDGPLKISYSNWYNELHPQFTDALVNLGIPVNKDPTSGSNAGASTTMFAVDPNLAVRSYTGNAYYQPNAHRSNLRLLPDAVVTRVLLDLVDGEYVAKGVEFLKDDKKYTVRAKREVILCCGAFHSPTVLELSGIGQANVLRTHGIPQIIDLPDHPWVPLVHDVDKNIETYDKFEDDPDFLNSQVKLYTEQKRGILAGSFSGYAYIPLDRMTEPEALKKFLYDIKNDTTLTGTKALQQQSDFLKKWISDTKHPQLEIIQFPVFNPLGQLTPPGDRSRRYQTLLLIDLHPLSRGSVHISSTDPRAAPMIDLGFLRNPRDVDVLVNSVRFAQKLLKTAPYSDCKPVLYDPTEDVIEDDEKLLKWIRDSVECLYHPVGTCSMLPKQDGGVVDSTLLVYGTKNLRVVDASILPLELSSHIQSTVYAVAEKAADIIKGKYGL